MPSAISSIAFFTVARHQIRACNLSTHGYVPLPRSDLLAFLSSFPHCFPAHNEFMSSNAQIQIPQLKILIFNLCIRRLRSPFSHIKTARKAFPPFPLFSALYSSSGKSPASPPSCACAPSSPCVSPPASPSAWPSAGVSPSAPSSAGKAPGTSASVIPAHFTR